MNVFYEGFTRVLSLGAAAEIAQIETNLRSIITPKSRIAPLFDLLVFSYKTEKQRRPGRNV